jgi:predicted enzyme related to lactoylglutathione lyase
MSVHKSRLATIVIDCNMKNINEAARFWSAALGWHARPLPDAEDANYRELVGPEDDVKVLIQIVDHPSRVHIDIEADDVDAEVRRLEALGAKRVHHLKRWWVMQAPTGQRFCVVRPQRPDFQDQANEWDTAAEKGSLTHLKR